MFSYAFCVLSVLVLAALSHQSQPNIVFLLTDDQDVTAQSLDYMPKLNKLLRNEGMEFVNYFVSTALCCPSRAIILRGQVCHNTKIWDNGDLNNKTYLSGGLKKYIEGGIEDENVATLLHDAGYETFLIGKYTNGYGDSEASHVPKGWDHWHGMTDLAFFGPHFSDQGKLVKTSEDTYQTDYISEHALKMLANRNSSKPFFIQVSPFAPHAPSTPAPRHAHLFPNMTAPRNPSFNPDQQLQDMKPSWIKHLPTLIEGQIVHIDEFYRNRLRALQAVDEMLENITIFLKDKGLDDNTYLFYMGDNGQHLGDYRITPGKRQAYDTDIRVPFLARGPGIKGGSVATEVVMSVDLLPTWTDLGGAKLPTSYEVDGKSVTPLLFGQVPIQPVVNTFRPVAIAEMYGGSSNMGPRYSKMAGFERNRFWNNTYQAVRVINGSSWAAAANWLYAEWCTGEREFYNVTADPHQIMNTVSALNDTMLTRLSLLTQVLGNCTGKQCSEIDFIDISLKADETKTVSRSFHCFNPPDMPGAARVGPAWYEEVEVYGPSRDVSCDEVLENGFPYSDSDVVTQPVLDVWHSCLQKQ